MRGAAATATTPTSGMSVPISSSSACGTTIAFAGGTRARSAATPGRASASSLATIVSGTPTRSRYAATRCSPSSTQRPVLRRSRDDETSRAISR